MQDIEAKYITFYCNEKLYAIDMIYAKGALEANKITYLPNSPDFLCGLFNHRGNIISVLNLAYLLEKKENLIGQKYENILILSYLDKNIALSINSINKILYSNKLSIKLNSVDTGETENYLYGTFTYEENNYIILNAINFYNLISFKKIKQLKEKQSNDIDINDIDNIDSSELSIIGSSQNRSNSNTNNIIKDTQKEVAELLKKLSDNKK